MGVTNVRCITNETGTGCNIHNRETPADDKSVQGGHTIDGINMWIPWCNTLQEFNVGKHIEFRFNPSAVEDLGEVRLYLIQKGDYLLYSHQRDDISSFAAVEGEAHEGGDRRLHLVTRTNAWGENNRYALVLALY